MTVFEVNINVSENMVNSSYLNSEMSLQLWNRFTVLVRRISSIKKIQELVNFKVNPHLAVKVKCLVLYSNVNCTQISDLFTNTESCLSALGTEK
jgi:hypothetical protein